MSAQTFGPFPGDANHPNPEADARAAIDAMDKPDEQGAITITVPFITRGTPFDVDDIGWARSLDGTEWITANHARREVRIAQRDIGKAVLAAWPAPPATTWPHPFTAGLASDALCAFCGKTAAEHVASASDYAKRLAAVEARASAATKGPWETCGNSVTAWDGEGGLLMEWMPNGIPRKGHDDDGDCNANYEADGAFMTHVREDVPWLLAQHRAASAALTVLGVPDDGRPLDERIDELHSWYDALHRAVVNIVCDRNDKARWSGLSKMGEAITRIVEEDSTALATLRGLALATWVNSGAERERFLLILAGALFDQGLIWDRASFPNGDPSPAGEKQLAAVYEAHGAPEAIAA